jgi:hypothetical protein
MYGARLARRAAAAAGALIVVTGCNLGSHTTTIHEPTTSSTVFRTKTPAPVKTIYRNYQTLQVNHTGQLLSKSQHAGVDIFVGKPSVSHTRLSTTHGYPPLHGSYVTFKIVIRNVGKVGILVQRLDFFVRTPGARKTTTDDGNSPASGSDSQLDSTELQPGQQISNFLTFDVAHPTGTFFYAPHGDKSLAWKF